MGEGEPGAHLLPQTEGRAVHSDVCLPRHVPPRPVPPQMKQHLRSARALLDAPHSDAHSVRVEAVTCNLVVVAFVGAGPCIESADDFPRHTATHLDADRGLGTPLVNLANRRCLDAECERLVPGVDAELEVCIALGGQLPSVGIPRPTPCHPSELQRETLLLLLGDGEPQHVAEPHILRSQVHGDGRWAHLGQVPLQALPLQPLDDQREAVSVIVRQKDAALVVFLAMVAPYVAEHQRQAGTRKLRAKVRHHR
mmetsp:Transcript_11339/g.27426  ORF Transcript_11339/g.27426 Transcript_11339/m.27426 type:complete len:253 (-) Transcript_11339:230-988(-)